MRGMKKMTTDIDFWDHSYYSLTKNVLCAVGQWPYQSFYDLSIRRLVMIGLNWFQIGAQILAVMHNLDNLELLMESGSVFIVQLAVLIDACTLMFNGRKIKFLLQSIKEDWNTLTEYNCLHVLFQYSEHGRQKSALWTGGMAFFVIAFVTQPVQFSLFHFFIKANVTGSKSFCTPMEFGPVNVEKYYYGLLILSGFTISANMTIILAKDILLFIFTYHVCGLFAALGYAVENLPCGKSSWGHDDAHEYNYLKRCVRLHCHAIELSEVIEDVFVWNFFTLVGMNMIVISVTAVQVVNNLDVPEQIFKMVTFAVGQIFHLFIQCFVAQKITDSSLSVQQSIMNSKWYYSTAKSRQLIVFMTMRSQIPCQLTAGKIMLMSLYTFSTIIKTSASYFTILLDAQ